MLHGAKVGLRARQQADVAVLHTELYEDIDARSRADTRPWRPISADSAASPFRVVEPSDGFDSFSVVELARDELAGDAVLWNIDPHNRSAHLGLALRPAFRGRRLGTDVVQVLCHTASPCAACTPPAGNPHQQHGDDPRSDPKRVCAGRHATQRGMGVWRIRGPDHLRLLASEWLR